MESSNVHQSETCDQSSTQSSSGIPLSRDIELNKSDDDIISSPKRIVETENKKTSPASVPRDSEYNQLDDMYLARDIYEEHKHTKPTLWACDHDSNQSDASESDDDIAMLPSLSKRLANIRIQSEKGNSRSDCRDIPLKPYLPEIAKKCENKNQSEEHIAATAEINNPEFLDYNKEKPLDNKSDSVLSSTPSSYQHIKKKKTKQKDSFIENLFHSGDEDSLLVAFEDEQHNGGDQYSPPQCLDLSTPDLFETAHALKDLSNFSQLGDSILNEADPLATPSLRNQPSSCQGNNKENNDVMDFEKSLRRKLDLTDKNGEMKLTVASAHAQEIEENVSISSHVQVENGISKDLSNSTSAIPSPMCLADRLKARFRHAR